MGNFHGHAIPGTLMLLLGLFYFLRALNLNSLRRLRTNSFGFPLRASALPSMGAVAEFLDALIPKADFSESHLDHIHVTSIVSLTGIITILHLYKVLESPAWGMVMPLGIVFVGTIFSAHPQENDLMTFGHYFSARLFYAFAASRALEFLIGYYLNKPFVQKVKAKVASWERKGGKKFSRLYHMLDIPRYLFCCCTNSFRDPKEEHEEVLLGLNHGYYNPIIYETIFPLADAFLMFFNGVWWWEMAVSFFLKGGSLTEAQKGHMATHYAYSHMVYPHFMWVLGFFSLLAILLKWFDKRYGGPSDHAHQYNFVVESELDIVDDNDNINGNDDDHIAHDKFIADGI